MINVIRDDNKVRLDFRIGVPNYEERELCLYWHCDNHIFAGLLSATMQTQMQNKLADLHRASYEAGWRDAKAKRAKRRFFRLGWSPMP